MQRETHCGTNVRLTGGVGVSVTSNMTGTEVDTNGHIRRPKKDAHTHTAAHVSWQQIRRGRTVIPRREGKKQQNLLTAEGRQKTKTGMACWGETSACRLVPSDGGKKHRNLTQYRGNYLKDNTDAEEADSGDDEGGKT